MAGISTKATSPEELARMHETYRKGGEKRQMAPHIVYTIEGCPHPGCDQHMQAIDFRLEAYGPTVHDPLVRAWWNDTGFAGQCPKCGGWVHFTILAKNVITADEAKQLPRLPADWAKTATIL